MAAHLEHADGHVEDLENTVAALTNKPNSPPNKGKPRVAPPKREALAAREGLTRRSPTPSQAGERILRES
jgi:hypothetical protein